MIKSYTKKFSKKDKNLFYNEIMWLEKLEKFKIAPKILNINHNKLKLELSYEGKNISKSNVPKNWRNQLKIILSILKKNGCHHSDLKPSNILVKNNKINIIDFAQSSSIQFSFIKKLNKNFYKKNRSYSDEFAIKRVNLLIENDLYISNDLRVMVIWDSKNFFEIFKKIKVNKKINIIDKIDYKKEFFKDITNNSIFWLNLFYNRDVSKLTNKLTKNFTVLIIESINPKFSLNKMFFTNEKRVTDETVIKLKKKNRMNRTNYFHISDNFEEAKRNAFFLSRSKEDLPFKYFVQTQYKYNSINHFMKRIKSIPSVNSVILRDQKSDNDDIDILVDNYHKFKRGIDAQSYKLKKLSLINNSGDPFEDYGHKVSNFILVKNRKVYLDIRYIGDNYFDKNWQKKIISRYGSKKKITDNQDIFYVLLYHIIYHKGYITPKYLPIIKKKLKIKNIKLDYLKVLVDKYMKNNGYHYVRPNDITIPVIFEMDLKELEEEFDLIKKQIHVKNFPSANKMIFNLFKVYKFKLFFFIKLYQILFLNTLSLLKKIFKFILFNNLKNKFRFNLYE